MNNAENQILNWLMIGISQSPNSLNESFYFDKKEEKFFSIVVTDYFMLDDNLNLAKNTTTSYSEQNQNKLVTLIKRIDKEDKDILFVPRLTHKERRDVLSEFLSSIDNPKEKEKIESLYLKTDDELTHFDKRFEIESSQKIVNEWNEFKDRILLSKAESFLNLNAINLNNASIMDFDNEGGITIDLTKDDNGNEIVDEKRWWEFWK
ncbi:MAG: hypothetical protein CMC05_11750 [Flavobacteriaceae bacterium]|nr:hypothetical protein [Flavobacteriaceae bacterium]|tara:strand:+ start:110 stop:727 length:618 start_codon:yes stop_codon:yes gene_type:complete